jgi:hypothetical protein
LRLHVGPINISSGYRSPGLNSIVGGVPTSQHCSGQAADTTANNLSLKDYYAKVKDLVRENVIIVDQVIFEFGSWVHISYVKNGNNRKQFLIAERQNGHTIYLYDN